MTNLIHITHVEPLKDHWLRLWFADGAVEDVDVSPILARGGVYAGIRDDRDAFIQVRLNHRTHAIEWPGDLDLDPAVLYGVHEPASGARLERRTVRGPSVV